MSVAEVKETLFKAILESEKTASKCRSSQKRKDLINYMMLGSIIKSVKTGKIFNPDDPQLFLTWSDGTPITITHEKLRTKLGFDLLY